MYKISFTAWERVQLRRFVGGEGQRGSFDELVLALKVFKILDLTEEEKEDIKWTNSPVMANCPRCNTPIQISPEGDERWDEANMEFKLEFEDAHFVLLQAAVKFDNWPKNMAQHIVPMLIKIKEAKLAS